MVEGQAITEHLLAVRGDQQQRIATGPQFFEGRAEGALRKLEGRDETPRQAQHGLLVRGLGPTQLQVHAVASVGALTARPCAPRAPG
jgi:hypothetical protein